MAAPRGVSSRKAFLQQPLAQGASVQCCLLQLHRVSRYRAQCCPRHAHSRRALDSALHTTTILSLSLAAAAAAATLITLARCDHRAANTNQQL